MNILRIALCDLRRMSKDRMAAVFMILMPMGFILLFGSIIQGFGPDRVWLPVFNFDGHELSELLIEELKGEGYSVDVRSAMDEQYVPGWSRAVIVPATFSEDLLKGETARFTFVEGEGNTEQNLSARARLVNTLVKFTGALAAVDPVTNKWTRNTREAFAEELRKPRALTAVEKSHASLRPPPAGFSFTLPGYLIMFGMMNTIMYGGITLVYERVYKQMSRLGVTPSSPLEIIAGKIIGRSLIPVMQSSLLLLIGGLAFGIPLGDHPLALIPVVIAFSLCCGGLGVLFGAVCSTEQQVSSLGILTGLLLAALGGCWWPLELMPETMKTVAAFTPTYWGVRGMHDVMSFGKSFEAIWLECAAMLAFGAAFTAAAVPFLRSRYLA